MKIPELLNVKYVRKRVKDYISQNCELDEHGGIIINNGKPYASAVNIYSIKNAVYHYNLNTHNQGRHINDLGSIGEFWEAVKDDLMESEWYDVRWETRDDLTWNIFERILTELNISLDEIKSTYSDCDEDCENCRYEDECPRGLLINMIKEAMDYEDFVVSKKYYYEYMIPVELHIDISQMDKLKGYFIKEKLNKELEACDFFVTDSDIVIFTKIKFKDYLRIMNESDNKEHSNITIFNSIMGFKKDGDISDFELTQYKDVGLVIPLNSIKEIISPIFEDINKNWYKDSAFNILGIIPEDDFTGNSVIS